MSNAASQPDLARYHRQMLLPGISETGQRALLESHALIVGCGALGSIIADSLTRAGVGTLTIVDRGTDPPVSVPRAMGTSPAATATADPLLEPPGI